MLFVKIEYRLALVVALYGLFLVVACKYGYRRSRHGLSRRGAQCCKSQLAHGQLLIYGEHVSDVKQRTAGTDILVVRRHFEQVNAHGQPARKDGVVSRLIIAQPDERAREDAFRAFYHRVFQQFVLLCVHRRELSVAVDGKP